MEITSISVELASRDADVSCDANKVLKAFGNTDAYLFNVDGPLKAVLFVGYVGDTAIAAASCYEGRKPKGLEDESLELIIDQPSLDIVLLATDFNHRRSSNGKQLVSSIINLAASLDIDRVVAFQPAVDARPFWSANGFQPVPYSSSDYYMLKDVSEPVLTNPEVEVMVSEEVVDRLTGYVQKPI